MSKELNKYYYYPYCKIDNCKGVLKFKINENFNINYECEKNINHKGENIFFKTFERFYLKKKEIEKCCKCFSNLESDYIYKCKVCDKLYCPCCFTSDEHLKKKINNLKIYIKKCKIHKVQLTEYCLYCKKNLCKYCLKSDININNLHKYHEIKSLIDLMPSIYEINDLKNKINKYDELLDSIDKWHEKLIKKIKNLQLNLLNEKELLSKIIFNFNPFFMNYTYYLNFHYLKEYIPNFNNNYLNEFSKTNIFEEQTKILMNYFSINKNNNKNIEIIPMKEGYLGCYEYSIDKGIIEKINCNCYFNYSSDKKEIKLMYYDKDRDSLLKYGDSTIPFKYKIYSVSYSKETNKIFACILKKKLVNIFDFNPDKKTIDLIENKIYEKNSEDHYNKCIQIINDFIVTADEDYICIWAKKENKNNYFKKYNYKLNTKTSDLLYVNDDYFISSQPLNNTITIFDNNTLTKEKVINNINSVDSQNCLLLFKEYILINCKMGVGLIYIKSKEYVQFMEDCIHSNRIDQKEICFDNDEKIYFLYHLKNKQKDSDDSSYDSDAIIVPYYNLRIITLIMIDGILQRIENYRIDKKFSKKFKIFSLNNNELILWNDNVYILKEKSCDNSNNYLSDSSNSSLYIIKKNNY